MDQLPAERRRRPALRRKCGRDHTVLRHVQFPDRAHGVSAAALRDRRPAAAHRCDRRDHDPAARPDVRQRGDVPASRVRRRAADHLDGLRPAFLGRQGRLRAAVSAHSARSAAADQERHRHSRQPHR